VRGVAQLLELGQQLPGVIRSRSRSPAASVTVCMLASVASADLDHSAPLTGSGSVAGSCRMSRSSMACSRVTGAVLSQASKDGRSSGVSFCSASDSV
jgi:hypothetical protein